MLPAETRRYRLLEQKSLELFSRYGYAEVTLPTVETLKVIEQGAGGKILDQLLLFVDRTGDILALRPEFTVSIARLAATHLDTAILPQRLCYSGSVFRHVQPQLAQYREFHQLGVELLGVQGPLADAEVVQIAVRLLKTLGLEGGKISLNHIGIFNGLLADSGLSAAETEDIRVLIAAKDLVGLKALLYRLPIPAALQSTLLRLPVLHGDEHIFEQLPYLAEHEATRAAVTELLQIYAALRDIYGVADYLVIDMGVLRGFDYYTGLIFEGYSPRLGYGLLGGGRYDHLLDQFGAPTPATGFAVGVERLDLALDPGEIAEPPAVFVAGLNLSAVSRQAETRRANGERAITALEPLSRAEALKIIQTASHLELDYVE
jgi:ATP phosphoribosyltransferase regulatory subunit